MQIIPKPKDLANITFLLPLNGFKIFCTEGVPGVYVTEVLHRDSTRNNDLLLDIPKGKEICGLLEKDTFRVICREETNIDVRILGGIFVLALKNKETIEFV